MKADEVKDASKKELLGVALRYVRDGKVKGRVIGFIELASLGAACITEQLINILEPFKLAKEDCVGQAYDGANVMSGEHGGVQALMREAGYTQAEYYHCASHRLNLVMSSVAAVDPYVNSLMVVKINADGPSFVKVRLHTQRFSHPCGRQGRRHRACSIFTA